MHSTVIATLALLLALGAMTGLGVSRSIEVVTLATLVAMVGVPHGALDHLAGQRLFRPYFGRLWGLAFFTVYLFTAVLVGLGWYVMPELTILGFFLVSAWHFGLEERDDRTGHWSRHLTAIATGGLIIWLPSLWRGNDVTELLSIIAPNSERKAIASCVAVVATLAMSLAPLCVIDCVARDRCSRRTDQSVAKFIVTSNSFRVLSVATMCVIVDPLIAFTVYFCGWHSVRGLRDLARSHGGSTIAMFRKLLPLTITALALAAIGAFVWSAADAFETTLIRTTFIGLSAMAVPHLCLHVVDDVCFLGIKSELNLV